MGTEPDAVLQVAEAAAAQIAPEVATVGTALFGNIKENQSPQAIPRPLPVPSRVASAESMHQALSGQPPDPILPAGLGWLAFNQGPLLESTQLPEQSLAISPAFERLVEVAKGRTHRLPERPEQKVEQFLCFRLHEETMARAALGCNLLVRSDK